MSLLHLFLIYLFLVIFFGIVIYKLKGKKWKQTRISLLVFYIPLAYIVMAWMMAYLHLEVVIRDKSIANNLSPDEARALGFSSLYFAPAYPIALTYYYLKTIPRSKTSDFAINKLRANCFGDDKSTSLYSCLELRSLYAKEKNENGVGEMDEHECIKQSNIRSCSSAMFRYEQAKNTAGIKRVAHHGCENGYISYCRELAMVISDESEKVKLLEKDCSLKDKLSCELLGEHFYSINREKSKFFYKLACDYGGKDICLEIRRKF